MNASLAQSGLALIVIVVYALAGWDPLVRLFYWGAAAGGIGAMLLITATSIAVIGYFARHRQDETIWHRITAPAISSALLLVVSCLALTTATLFGGEPTSRLTWIIPAVFAVVALAGAGWGLILRIRSPQVYAVVGLGLESVDRSGVGHSRPNDASHLQDSPFNPLGVIVTSQSVHRACKDEIDAVGALIALSFNDLDANAYLVPPLADRQRVCGDYFTLCTQHAFDHGRIDIIKTGDRLSAAAVWFDRTRDIPDQADYENRLADMAGPYLDRFQALDALFEEHHPAEPHWHLALLGVHPDCQNNGLGSVLLKHLHDETDIAGVPQYLEASNQNSARLYRRHGYRDMSPSAIRLPDGTPFFRMWRPAPPPDAPS